MFIEAIIIEICHLIHYSVPPNCSFLVDDVELDWLRQESFDFIFLRCLSCSIRDWPRLLRQAYR
jgi:hypothetical protein